MPPAPHIDGIPTPQRYWAIATLALGIVMAVMDSAIANVALPTIGIDLHADPALSIWIVNGYQLAITISLLPLAALGDIVGYLHGQLHTLPYSGERRRSIRLPGRQTISILTRLNQLA